MPPSDTASGDNSIVKMVVPAPSPHTPEQEPAKEANDEEPEPQSTATTTTTTTIEHDPRDMTKTPPISARKTKGKRGRSGKKPADMPRRPLSGYNYFFSDQRSTILEEQSKVKDEKRDIFTTLGRIVADRWKKLTDKEKEKYNDLAAKDLIRYRKEMEQYNEKIAMRNRKEAERKQGETGAVESSKAAGSTSHNALSSFTASHGLPTQVAAVAAASQTPTSSVIQAPLAQYPIGLQSNLSLLGAGLPLNGGLGLSSLHSTGQLDLGLLALVQQQALAGRLDPLSTSPDLRQVLGHIAPAHVGVFPRFQLPHPSVSGASGITQRSALQLPFSSQTASSLLAASAVKDSTPSQGIASAATPLNQQLLSVGVTEASIRQLQQQDQRMRDESIRQAYVDMLERHKKEEEEALRRLGGSG